MLTLFNSVQVSVTVRDKHIQGSPFKVNVLHSGEAYLKFGKKGSEIAEFNGIFGVAVDDEGHIIITDCHNHRVQVFNHNGGFMFQFGRKGEGSGQFQCPTGVGVDPDGRIVVCERLGSRIQVRHLAKRRRRCLYELKEKRAYIFRQSYACACILLCTNFHSSPISWEIITRRR